MGKLAKMRSEVSYNLSVLSHGSCPKARRQARKMQRKLLRATDQWHIAQGLRDHAIEQLWSQPYEEVFTYSEWDLFVGDCPDTLWRDWKRVRQGIDAEDFCKTLQSDALWHNHEIAKAEDEADERWYRRCYPEQYHDTNSWNEDTSWHEDAEEFFHEHTITQEMI